MITIDKDQHMKRIHTVYAWNRVQYIVHNHRKTFPFSVILVEANMEKHFHDCFEQFPNRCHGLVLLVGARSSMGAGQLMGARLSR